MIRVIVADDHAIVREGIKRLVDDWDDIEVVAEATDGDDVVLQCRECPADVLLLDVSMSGPGFLETLSRVRRVCASLNVLVLSVHSGEEYALHALRAGAAGYLTTEHSPEELVKAIRRVHAGHKHVTRSLADRLVSELAADRDRLPHELLSKRELQILCSIGSGRTMTEIARTTNLSPKTVSTYRARILSKTGMRNTVQLMRYALEHDLSD